MERCLSMLPFTKNKKVEDFITKLNNHHVEPSAIENNLTVVMEADLDEMDGILDIISDLGMPLEDNLSILKYTTTQRLRRIVEYMQGQGIRDNAIKRELKSIVRDDGKLGIKVEDIFERRNSEDRQVQLKKVKRYMKLTGMIGQYYTRENIEPFCAERNITVREFVEGIVCSNMNRSSIGNKPNSISKIYYEKIMDGKKLYVGPSKPIDPEYLEEHAEEILELARISAKKFLIGRQTPDEDELSGLATELIMAKCGNLVDNLQDYPNALRGSIVNRTARYLHSVVEQNLTVSMTQKFVSRSGEVEIKDNEYAGDVNGDNPYDTKTSLQGVVDYERAEFDQDETDIMNYMIRLIEEGEADDLYQKIAENFGMEEDEVLETIQSIRKKMIQKKLVRENVRRGGYEFNRGDDEDIDVDDENFDI